MRMVEVINNGSDQSIHLPADCRIETQGVFVKRIGQALLLIPKDVDPWQLFSQSLDDFTQDFMEDRDQPTEQQRKAPFE